MFMNARASADQITRKVRVRVTYYSPEGCKWGDRVACQKTKRAREGVTVAADPKKYPYGTKVFIPALKGLIGDGNFIVQDTGGAVKSMKASKGKADIIDVYVTTNAKIRRHMKNDMYMSAYITKQ